MVKSDHGLLFFLECGWVNRSSLIMVISPYHTIIGDIYDLPCTIKSYINSPCIYIIGGGGEYYL